LRRLLQNQIGPEFNSRSLLVMHSEERRLVFQRQQANALFVAAKETGKQAERSYGLTPEDIFMHRV
jgi:hypothetical protein